MKNKKQLSRRKLIKRIGGQLIKQKSHTMFGVGNDGKLLPPTEVGGGRISFSFGFGRVHCTRFHPYRGLNILSTEILRILYDSYVIKDESKFTPILSDLDL